MTTKQPDFPDLNILAIEACDVWQEHLSSLASDPAARADLTRFLEPQRRMFADWASMMQKGGNPESHRTQTDAVKNPGSDSQRTESLGTESKGVAETPPSPTPPLATPQGGAAHGDDPLRVAQLALRVAELEKRIARLESSAASSPRRTQRAAS